MVEVLARVDALRLEVRLVRVRVRVRF